jgi:hypothetical protein
MVINNEQIGFTRTLPVSQVVRKVFTPEIAEGRYLAKLAQTPAEVESALRLRKPPRSDLILTSMMPVANISSLLTKQLIKQSALIA